MAKRARAEDGSGSSSSSSSSSSGFGGGGGSSESHLKVNVGGAVFVTKRATLCVDSESMLAKMFDVDSPFGQLETDDNGHPFIDRDADTFKIILSYLRRGGRLVGTASLTEDLAERVKDDAEYFGLQGLVASLERHISIIRLKKAPKLKFVINKTFTPGIHAIDQELTTLTRQGYQITSANAYGDPYGSNMSVILEKETGAFLHQADTDLAEKIEREMKAEEEGGE